MLDLFDRCYRKEDPKMMHVNYRLFQFLIHYTLTDFSFNKHCAQTLQDFNGGASCVQIYVNQHDFFINSVRQRSDFEDPIL